MPGMSDTKALLARLQEKKDAERLRTWEVQSRWGNPVCPISNDLLWNVKEIRIYRGDRVYGGDRVAVGPRVGQDAKRQYMRPGDFPAGFFSLPEDPVTGEPVIYLLYSCQCATEGHIPGHVLRIKNGQLLWVDQNNLFEEP
jgi:hypothetical protein